MSSAILKNLNIAEWDAAVVASKLESARSADNQRDKSLFSQPCLNALIEQANDVQRDIIGVTLFAEAVLGGDPATQPILRYGSNLTHQVHFLNEDGEWEPVGPPMTGTLEQCLPHLHGYREQNEGHTYKLFQVYTTKSTSFHPLNF